MKNIIRGTVTLLLLIILTSCNSSASDHNEKNADFIIYTSIYPIQYIVEQLTQNDATVYSVYPPGVDAHTYEPTSKEITNIANGDAFIYLGAGMEGFAEAAADALASQDVAFIELGKHESLFNQCHTNHSDEHHHGDKDPHIWIDPLRMIEMAAIIKDELIKLNDEHATDFEENFIQLKEKLTALDQAFVEKLNHKTDKHLMVAHAAYSYWEERYGIEQIAVSGVSTGDEPSQRELVELAKNAKEQHLKHVIFDQNGKDRVAAIIQDHIGAEAFYIHNLEVLTDEDIKNKEDYVSIMEANLDILDQVMD